MALPPLSSSGVFTSTASIRIDAPREKVWEALLDFDSYKECRGQILVTPSGAKLDGPPAVDALIKMEPVHLPPTMGDPAFMGSQSALVRIIALDHENYRAAWVTASMPKWALFAERWQTLTVEDGITKYESVEVFSGILAYVVKWFVGKALDQGMMAMAEGLKSRCENA
ncbi:hypothetical protein R3P38DRAFT_2846903 [Favolaschia claudopus]|uniref:Uncharacterized protein n=1 Tax=Favolaschia claudopus TaxID=2862362 RepID=A0AAW0DV57_9AGAR